MSNRVLNISADDFSELPKMGLEDTGTMTIKFKVKGANIYDDESMSESVNYTMEYDITEISVDEVSLGEAARRAFEKQKEPILVKNTTSPFPAG